MSGHCVPTLHRKKRLCEEHKTTCYFVCFRKDAGISLEKNSSLYLSFTDPGGPYQLMFKGSLAIWQAGNLASPPLFICFPVKGLDELLSHTSGMWPGIVVP
ncbi:hypothetical protein AVEN_33967-1 [Araneus ventricosus]|uniref:Uncharacterized protein n=1 Tax=Araneus ventricosus TaxID=182803 RepID=A0A4Y2MCL3_ARAVE|nr:hypothetical protein AVEN_33967-1 [Araneus ventricosus]